MYNVIAILPRGQGVGFSMAGLRVKEVTNVKNAHEVLTEAMEDDNNGVILIDETYTEEMPPRLRKKVDDSSTPLVVSIPVITKWEYVMIVRKLSKT